MSGTLNKVMLIGHTGDDVKMHYFEGGNSLGRFPLATNETYTNKNTNERVTNTEWHNIVVRNKAAEICEKYLKKGDMVYIEGRLKTRKWQDEKGLDRYSTEVHCTDFTFLTPKGGTAPAASGNTTQTKQEPSKPAQPSQVQDTNEEEDDLPF
ncbi:single-stranded DNA-binding protein [Aequorivita capsosiphonis]|uniref:single-stranded DNA-binding protein n=1 Tax=Aequorivita capsosiphonis TaxID=487317 RepID=UPI00041126AD|nr:single-stranded DNA-binding protein [Aequorivita capsosiphonis]